MQLQAIELYAQKLKQIEIFPDSQVLFINAQDLEAFGHQVPEGVGPRQPLPITAGEFRALGAGRNIPDLDDGCEGCQ